jgi:hypothetical protein
MNHLRFVDFILAGPGAGETATSSRVFLGDFSFAEAFVFEFEGGWFGGIAVADLSLEGPVLDNLGGVPDVEPDEEVAEKCCCYTAPYWAIEGRDTEPGVVVGNPAPKLGRISLRIKC